LSCRAVGEVVGVFRPMIWTSVSPSGGNSIGVIAAAGPDDRVLGVGGVVLVLSSKLVPSWVLVASTIGVASELTLGSVLVAVISGVLEAAFSIGAVDVEELAVESDDVASVCAATV